MADVSSAFGKIRFYALEEDMQFLISTLASRHEQYYYPTEIYNLTKPERIEGPMFMCTGDFRGGGRWIYEENIEKFIRWPLDDLHEEEAERLQNMPFRIEFDFIDIEIGCRELYKAMGVVTHSKGKNLEETFGASAERVYPWNRQSMEELGFPPDVIAEACQYGPHHPEDIICDFTGY